LFIYSLKNNIIVFPPKLCQILPSLLVWPAYKMYSLLVAILQYQKYCLSMSIYGSYLCCIILEDYMQLFISKIFINCWLKHKSYLSVVWKIKSFCKVTAMFVWWCSSPWNSACFFIKVAIIWTSKWTFIGACAQINVRENVFVCISAFVLKTILGFLSRLCTWVKLYCLKPLYLCFPVLRTSVLSYSWDLLYTKYDCNK